MERYQTHSVKTFILQLLTQVFTRVPDYNNVFSIVTCAILTLLNEFFILHPHRPGNSTLRQPPFPKTLVPGPEESLKATTPSETNSLLKPMQTHDLASDPVDANGHCFDPDISKFPNGSLINPPPLPPPPLTCSLLLPSPRPFITRNLPLCWMRNQRQHSCHMSDL